VNIRKSVNHLTSTEKSKFVAACLKLKYTPSPISGRTWDTWARWHMEAFIHLHSRLGEPVDKITHFHSYVHGTPAFLPWHRLFTRLLELDLQAVSGDSDLTIPYWDWSYDAALSDPTKSAMWDEEFMGGSGKKEDDWVVKDGPFAYQGGRWNLIVSEGIDPDITDATGKVIPGLGKDGPELRRAIGLEPTAPEITRTLPTVNVVKEILELPFDHTPWNKMPTPIFNNKNFPEDEGKYDPKKHNFFRNRFERDLHNVGHRWVGRTMLRGTAPNDPAFFLHHSNVDRIWSKWQDKHLGDSYIPLLPIPGVPGCGIDDDMYPFDRKVREVLNRFALGYDYDGMASDDGIMPENTHDSSTPSGGGGHGH
jgi:tyrosinase